MANTVLENVVGQRKVSGEMNAGYNWVTRILSPCLQCDTVLSHNRKAFFFFLRQIYSIYKIHWYLNQSSPNILWQGKDSVQLQKTKGWHKAVKCSYQAQHLGQRTCKTRNGSFVCNDMQTSGNSSKKKSCLYW